MKHYMADQRGVAMVLEVLLVAIVLVAVGAAVATRYHANQPIAAPQPTTAKVPPTVANGSVSDAVNSITQESTGDSASAQEEGAFVPATDTSSGSAQNVEGSYNENTF
jgi:Na+-transporting methylmalonyl-CoA/oxaloacetate decarboxylase gamma subunit